VLINVTFSNVLKQQKKNLDILYFCDTLQLAVTCSFHPHSHLNTGNMDSSEIFVSILPSKRRHALKDSTSFMALTLSKSCRAGNTLRLGYEISWVMSV